MNDSTVDILKARLNRGADALAAKEALGDLGEEYQRWLASWFKLKEQYEAAETPTPDPQPPSGPALDVAIRVAMQPQARLDSAADVYRLARQLDAFAGGDTIVGLPIGR